MKKRSGIFIAATEQELEAWRLTFKRLEYEYPLATSIKYFLNGEVLLADEKTAQAIVEDRRARRRA